MLIEAEAERVHQQSPQNAVAQMPQISRPDALDSPTIGQLPKDGIDERANPAQDSAFISCRRVSAGSRVKYPG